MALSGPAVDARYFGEGGPVSTFRRFYGSGTASGDTRAPVRQSVCDGTGGLRSRFAAGERSGAVVHAKEGGAAEREGCLAGRAVRERTSSFGIDTSKGQFLRSRFAAGERSGAVVHAKEGGVAGHGRRHCVAAQRVRAEAFRFGSCRSAGRFAGGESERL